MWIIAYESLLADLKEEISIFLVWISSPTLQAQMCEWEREGERGLHDWDLNRERMEREKKILEVAVAGASQLSLRTLAKVG